MGGHNIEDFRLFMQAIIALPLPKPKKKVRFKKVVEVPMAIKPDEMLLDTGKPFRFSSLGAKRKIQKRKR